MEQLVKGGKVKLCSPLSFQLQSMCEKKQEDHADEHLTLALPTEFYGLDNGSVSTTPSVLATESTCLKAEKGF